MSLFFGDFKEFPDAVDKEKGRRRITKIFFIFAARKFIKPINRI